MTPFEFLSSKVTDEAEFNSYALELNNDSRLRLVGQTVEAPWWLRREWLRMQLGVYAEHTNATGWLMANNTQLAVHISKEDPKMVAYTPDRQCGASDRQVRTTLARLLTKLYPAMPDEAIAKIQAAHLAELDGTFIEITDIKEISEVYTKYGFGACMSYETDRYGLGSFRPTDIYDMPNISMAVLKDEEGRVTARSMLFCPTPEDKRFIRTYGDRDGLRSRLIRAGYKVGTWIGAEFKKIPAPNKGDKCYVMPYLDGLDGRGGNEHSNVALLDGKLVCVEASVAKALKNIDNYTRVVSATSTAGYVALRNTESAQFERTCPLSGKKWSILDPAAHLTEYWHPTQQRVVQALKSEVLERGLQCVQVTSSSMAYVDQDVELWVDVRRERTWLVTEENMAYNNLKKLDPNYYPDNQFVKTGNEYREAANGFAIKVEDAIYYVPEGRTGFERCHRLAKLDTWVKLHAKSRDNNYYAESAGDVITTASGRKVVEYAYDVAKCQDGTWDFCRNIKTITVAGRVLNISRKVSDADYAAHTPAWKAVVAGVLGSVIRNRSGGIREAARHMALSMLNSYTVVCGYSLYRLPKFIGWSEMYADNNVNCVPELQYVNYLVECFMAEANALDYSIGQRSEPLPTVTALPVPVVEVMPAAGHSTEQPWIDALYTTGRSVTSMRELSIAMAHLPPVYTSGTPTYTGTVSLDQIGTALSNLDEAYRMGMMINTTEPATVQEDVAQAQPWVEPEPEPEPEPDQQIVLEEAMEEVAQAILEGELLEAPWHLDVPTLREASLVGPTLQGVLTQAIQRNYGNQDVQDTSNNQTTI